MCFIGYMYYALCDMFSLNSPTPFFAVYPPPYFTNRTLRCMSRSRVRQKDTKSTLPELVQVLFLFFILFC